MPHLSGAGIDHEGRVQSGDRHPPTPWRCRARMRAPYGGQGAPEGAQRRGSRQQQRVAVPLTGAGHGQRLTRRATITAGRAREEPKARRGGGVPSAGGVSPARADLRRDRPPAREQWSILIDFRACPRSDMPSFCFMDRCNTSLSLLILPQPSVAWRVLLSFLFALQWTIVTMFSTNEKIYHRLISQAGWNRCNLSIYLSIYSASSSIVLLTRDIHRSFICLLPWSIYYSGDSAHYWEQSSNQPDWLEQM